MFYVGKNLRIFQNLRKRIIKEIFKNKRFEVLVDIGCGEGHITNIMAQYANKTWGVDKICHALAGDRKFKFQKLANDTYPFDPSSVDCVTLLEVIEHQENPDILLEKIYKILKPKGILVLSTPNLKSLQRELYFAALYQGRKQKYPTFPRNLGWDSEQPRNDNTHFQEYTIEAMKDMLTKHGFKIKRIRGTLFGFRFYYKGYVIGIGSDILARLFPNLSNAFFVVAEK